MAALGNRVVITVSVQLISLIYAPAMIGTTKMAMLMYHENAHDLTLVKTPYVSWMKFANERDGGGAVRPGWARPMPCFAALPFHPNQWAYQCRVSYL
jgi:hypothetical protein